MVTWKPDPSYSRPVPQQNSSSAAFRMPDDDRHSGLSKASHDGAELAPVVEAPLAPGEIEVGESPDTAPGRLEADQRMVEAILEEGVDGPKHQALNDALIKYAEPVLRQVLRDGRIIGMCAKLRRPRKGSTAKPRRPRKGSAAWLDFTDEDCEEFACEMVARAMPVFTEAVFVTRKWSADPDRTGGRPASLTTYFVNACAMQFLTLYRKWLKNRRAQPAGLQLDLGGAGAVCDISEAVCLQDEVLGLLKNIRDPKIREVLALRAIGYTAAEAAELVGLTEKAAEGRLARIRRSLKKRAEQCPVISDGITTMEDGGCSDVQEV